MATDVGPMPPELALNGLDGLYEVIDGRVVEKVMDAYEIEVAALLLEFLLGAVTPNRLGRARMEMFSLIDPALGLKRRPDVSFVSAGRWPLNRPVPRSDA